MTARRRDHHGPFWRLATRWSGLVPGLRNLVSLELYHITFTNISSPGLTHLFQFLLGPTMKLKRLAVLEKYKDVIDSFYQEQKK